MKKDLESIYSSPSDAIDEGIRLGHEAAKKSQVEVFSEEIQEQILNGTSVSDIMSSVYEFLDKFHSVKNGGKPPMKTPKDFRIFPSSSVLQKCEAEQVACNVMVILYRTGNTFREITWEEYRTERKKDKDFTSTEEFYFDQVLPYCRSQDTAELFSPEWKDTTL